MIIMSPTDLRLIRLTPGMINKFKNASGAYLTLSMFYETAIDDKSQVIYTLKDRDHAGYPSLYLAYMAANDPTEYSFAIANLDGWSHWERLCRAGWFKPYVSTWRRELELRTRSEALLRIREKAMSEDKEAFQANKYLLNGQWKDKPEKRRAGAPTKQDIREAANDIATTEQTLQSDLSRIKGLN